MDVVPNILHFPVTDLNLTSSRDLLMKDFEALETSQFPSKGGHQVNKNDNWYHHHSLQTPAHSFPDFTFRTYAPVAFRYPCFCCCRKLNSLSGISETSLGFRLLNSWLVNKVFA